MNEQNKTVIEVNGVKMEVDLRTARRIEEIRVGSRVKILRKEYSSYKVLHGVVIGFEPFKQLPTIIVAAAVISYNSANVEFIYYNGKSEDLEIVVAMDDDLAALDKNDFLRQCEVEIAKKQNEIKEIENRREFFLAKFKCYWEPLEQAVKDATA